MKKLNISLILILSIFCSIFGYPIKASAESRVGFEKTAVIFLEAYYLAKDHVDISNKSPEFDNVNIENYINKRIDIESSAKKAANIIKLDYKVTSTLIKKEIRDSLHYLTYGIRQDFNYKGLKEPTVVSNEVVVIGNENAIIDVLFPYDPIEKVLRGTSDKINLSKSQRLDSLDVDMINYRAEEYKTKLLKSIDDVQVDEQEATGIKDSISLDPIRVSIRLSWAKVNFNKHSPISGSISVPY